MINEINVLLDKYALWLKDKTVVKKIGEDWIEIGAARNPDRSPPTPPRQASPHRAVRVVEVMRGEVLRCCQSGR